jgi:diaminopimelate epimerase
MKIDFYKYQGAGNDFVIIDNRKGIFPKDDFELIRSYCDRKFGIGADGLMLLEGSTDADFNMVYYNADGRPGSMCGNGGRCIVAFAKTLGIFEKSTSFIALGEKYNASIIEEQVSLKMLDVENIEIYPDHVFLDTGSPHHVTFTENLPIFDVVGHGRKIRYGAPYFEAGANVNFVEKINKNTFSVRTYERGVENETLSCGTGVTAVALASFHLDKTNEKEINIETQGGKLKIEFEKENNTYKNIILTGPATFVFKGSIELSS